MPRVKGIKTNIKKKYNDEQTELLLESLKVLFINNKDYLDTIQEIITNKRKIKLAMIDYVTTIYSKKNKSAFLLNDDFFYINDEYKNQLKSYTKRHFDPFKRYKKIDFHYDDVLILTTVGQLNFLTWAIKNKVIEYIENNFNEITVAMDKYLQNKKEKYESKKKKVAISAC